MRSLLFTLFQLAALRPSRRRHASRDCGLQLVIGVGYRRNIEVGAATGEQIRRAGIDARGAD